VQEEKVKKETLAKVENVSNDGIVKEVTGLKTTINSSLDALLQNMTSEFKKLEEIRAAIAIEKQSYEDLYSLSVNTDSLAAMLLAQKEQRESFEAEMKARKEELTAEITQKRAEWEVEKSKQKTSEKEYLEELARNRKREDEEFLYAQKIKRQKEQDAYDAKRAQQEKELTERKAAFEQEIAAREQALKIAEAELAELRKNNAEFPVRLEKALADKEKEITKQLTTKYTFDIQLIEKQNEADVRLKDQIIASLQEKIKEQQAQLKEYADKATRAEASVKDIAVKAIENAAKTKMYIKPEKDDA